MRRLRRLLAIAVVATATGCAGDATERGDQRDATVAEPDATAPTTPRNTVTPVTDLRPPSTRRERTVARVAADIYKVLATGDAAAVCERLTSAAQVEAGLNRGGCAAVVEEVVTHARSTASSDQLRRAKALEVGLHENGEYAAATVTIAGSTVRVTLREVEGVWLLNIVPPLPDRRDGTKGKALSAG